MRAFAVCLVGWLLAWPGWLAAIELSPAEAAGKRIYQQGRSDSGNDIAALVGAADIPMPASFLPCSSCHGADGAGRPEGGVRPPAITWQRLTVPYGQHTNGRSYPAYDEGTLARALIAGLDSAGNPLDPAMPRFALSAVDLKNLIAYLKRLEDDHEPGVTSDSLQLGTLLPASGPERVLGQTIETVLRTALQEINQAGGIHGRQLELLVMDSAAESGVDMSLLTQQVFALLAPLVPQQAGDIFGPGKRPLLPAIGPLSTGAGNLGGALSFEVMPGLQRQWLALSRHVISQFEPGSALILHQRKENSDRLAGLLADHLTAEKWQVQQEVYSDQGIHAAKSGTDVLFFLGTPTQLLALGEALRHAPQVPVVLGLSAHLTDAALRLPEVFSQRVLLAYPFIPDDWTEQGLADLASIRRAAALDSRYLLYQVGALGAVQVMAEGLRRSGRDISRTRLVAGLEGMHGFHTGLTPPISYGPGRRGPSAVHIVQVDIRNQRFHPLPVDIKQH